MKIDGFAVQYLLSQGFENVQATGLSRHALVDYPILYDETSDMSGHVVLVPDHERPFSELKADGSIFVCIGEEAAASARNAGFATIEVPIEITFRQLYNYMQAVFVRNERLDAQLAAYVTSFAGYQPLLDACAESMGCKCALIDEQFRIVAQADPRAARVAGEPDSRTDGAAESAEKLALLDDEVIDLFMASGNYRRMRASRNPFTIPGSNDLFMKNIFAEDHLIGTLIMSFDGTSLHAHYTLFLLNYLSPFVEQMYERIGTFDLPSSHSSRVRAMLPSAFNGEAAGIAGLTAALLADGHDAFTSYAALRIERSFTHESDAELDYLAHRFELALPHSYCFTEAGKLYMLVDVGEERAAVRSAFLQALPVAARDNLAKVGVSRPFDDMTQLPNACAQASIALAQGSIANPTYWYYRFNEYALGWLIGQAASNLPPELTCHNAILMLTEYDKDHGTDLALTLETFMRSRYNATEAANKLFVARSTLLNRLTRIEELTRINLDDYRERLYLALSFEMLR